MGRVLTNAETRPFPWKAAPHRLASMGPRSQERGNGVDDRPRPRLLGTALQWGRVLTNAETHLPATCEIDRDWIDWLQWGRVLTNAETRSVNHPTTRGCRASMGPRSHERGNAAPELQSAIVANGLQWGRVLTNAETAPTLSLDRTGHYLPCFERHLEWVSILALDSYGRRV